MEGHSPHEDTPPGSRDREVDEVYTVEPYLMTPLNEGLSTSLHALLIKLELRKPDADNPIKRVCDSTLANSQKYLGSV